MSTSITGKLICSECGVEMNFHAEKLIYSEPAPNSSTALGEQIEEMHTCPHCGRTGSRRSSGSGLDEPSR